MLVNMAENKACSQLYDFFSCSWIWTSWGILTGYKYLIINALRTSVAIFADRNKDN